MLDTTFAYHPLDEDFSTIRLLRVSSGAEEEELCCTIEHVPFTTDLQYRALSYAWRDSSLDFGLDAKQAERLIVNKDCLLLIGKNLAAFLRQIRDLTVPTAYWWIDAVCINQEDIRERNRHVIKMGEVYKRATDVLVWLGPHQGDSVLAMSFITRIAQLGDATHDPSGHEFKFWDASVKQRLQNTSQESGDADASWAAVVKLMKRAWWRRTWVIQEVMLAKDFTFMCGNSTLDWMSLWRTLENLWAHSHVRIITAIAGFCLLSS